MPRANATSEAVSRPTTNPDAPARRIVRARTDAIQPVIRIAHRVRQRMEIPTRVIFDHELVLVVRGAGRYRREGRDYPFHASDVLCIPPFAPHAISQTGDGACEHIAIHFDFARDVPPRAEEPADRRPYVVRFPGIALPTAPARATEAMAVAFERILAERSDESALADLAAATALTETLIALFRATAPTAPTTVQEAKIARVTAYIEANYAATLTVADLAGIADLSPSRFSALFREQVGASPVDFVQRTRVAAARKLLGDLRLSIKEVAAQVGIDDPLHFSKLFRRIDGLSPTQYRNALLAGDGEEKR
jgi:AraC-like DNA-binding protein/mannose-6-phosphate isomerase-like protein (cupin superfamily)